MSFDKGGKEMPKQDGNSNGANALRHWCDRNIIKRL